MRLPLPRRVLLALALLFGSAAACMAGTAAPDYQLRDLAACTKPKLAPPGKGTESYAKYQIQRRYLDLDGSGQCVVMDYWIARLGGSAAVGMRTLEHRYLHFAGGKWIPFEMQLRYFPYALTSRQRHQTVLVEAPASADVDDDMALRDREPRLFSGARWQSEPGMLDQLLLDPVSEDRGEILQTLALLLAERWRASKERNDYARQHILELLAEANKDASIGRTLTLSPSDGLPVWPNE